MASSRRFASVLVSLALVLASGAALGYGGGLGPIEKNDKGKATDYRNPQPDPRQPVDVHPRRYHVTVCADNTWYGPWTPPEWRGLDGAVSANITAKGQNHGYAKGSDGSDGGLQVKGGGTGSTDPASISRSYVIPRCTRSNCQRARPMSRSPRDFSRASSTASGANRPTMRRS